MRCASSDHGDEPTHLSTNGASAWLLIPDYVQRRSQHPSEISHRGDERDAGGADAGYMETLLIPLHSMSPGMPPVGGLLIALLIAFIAIRLVRSGRVGPVRLGARGGGSPRQRPGRDGRTPEDAALATLRDRLAAGDITTEQYLSRSSVLPPTPLKSSF